MVLVSEFIDNVAILFIKSFVFLAATTDCTINDRHLKNVECCCECESCRKAARRLAVNRRPLQQPNK